MSLPTEVLGAIMASCEDGADVARFGMTCKAMRDEAKAQLSALGSARPTLWWLAHKASNDYFMRSCFQINAISTTADRVAVARQKSKEKPYLKMRTDHTWSPPQLFLKIEVPGMQNTVMAEWTPRPRNWYSGMTDDELAFHFRCEACVITVLKKPSTVEDWTFGIHSLRQASGNRAAAAAAQVSSASAAVPTCAEVLRDVQYVLRYMRQTPAVFGRPSGQRRTRYYLRMPRSFAETEFATAMADKGFKKCK